MEDGWMDNGLVVNNDERGPFHHYCLQLGCQPGQSVRRLTDRCIVHDGDCMLLTAEESRPIQKRMSDLKVLLNLQVRPNDLHDNIGLFQPHYNTETISDFHSICRVHPWSPSSHTVGTASGNVNSQENEKNFTLRLFSFERGGKQYPAYF